MRRIIISFFLLSCSMMLFSQTVKSEELLSEVTHVTIYPEWAFVTRTASVNIKKGENSFSITELPSWIDTDSVQVGINDCNGCKIVGVTTSTVYLEQIGEGEVRDLEIKLTEMQDRIDDLNTKLEVLEEQKKYLFELAPWKIDKVSHESAARIVDVSELKAVETYISDSLLSVMEKQNEIRRTIRDLTPELDAVRKKWAEKQSKANLEKKEITVDISSEKDSTLELNVSYLISGASWYPYYDVRRSKDGNDVTVLCRAVVQQSTGEDWTNATFSLSTIKPYLVREKPELSPWYVSEVSNISVNYQTFGGGFNRGYNDEAYNKLNTIQEQQREYFLQDEEKYKAYENYNLNVIELEEVIEQAEERGTTVEFAVKGNYSILTDGKPVKLFIGETLLKAKLQYSAAPAVSQSTYVTALMDNDSSFPFLPGNAEVYNGNNLVGKSRIDFVAVNERFELYMGLEERIKVTRAIDKKNSSHTFFGKKKVLNVGYNIEIQNYMDGEAVIIVSDQIPVSQNSSVKVKLNTIDPVVTPDEKGILNWEIKLVPNGKKTVSYDFELEYPSSVTLENAQELERQLMMM